MSLLNKAIDDLDDSRTLYDDMKKKNPDNMRLTNICYHVQQCIEKVLKRLIELKGEKYPYDHDIGALVLTVMRLYDDNVNLKNILYDVQSRATMYTSWESSTRYPDGFYEVVRNVDEAYILCDKLISECIGMEGLS